VKEQLSNSTTDEDEAIHEPTFKKKTLEFSEENLSLMQQHAVNQLSKMSNQQFKILFSSPSLDHGNKSATTSIEQVLDMTRKLPFIFSIIPYQSSSKVLDSFKKF
jgi:hypothetical protein